jgi:hypothetical protein
MTELNLRSIEPLVTIPLVLVHPKCTQAKRRKQCLTAWKVTGLTRSCDAQSVRASLASSGIIRGERRFAPGSVSIASRRAAKVTTIGWAGSKSPSTSRPENRPEGVMTLQFSQRGKEYLKTVQTLLRTAKSMTDQAIAAHLKALADGCERRAEKASIDGARHCSIRRSH